VRRTLEDLGAEIERRWTSLGSPPPEGELKIMDLPQGVAAGPLLLGIAGDGSRLLVPLEPDAHRSLKPDRKSRGVQLLLRQLEEEGGRRWYLDVVCVKAELRWLFSSFVADVLLRFERQSDVDPTSIVRTCFSAWRALFAGGGPRMTLKQLAGLYGELHVLGRLVARSPAAIERWRGPLREPHDFVSPRMSIEVKTTLSSEDDVVHIHGLEQLTEPSGGQLCLAHLRVETPSPDGDSLNEVIKGLEESDHDGRLQGLLASAGYQAAEKQAYGELTFALVNERWFDVDASFPRLSSQTFPGGVVPDGLADFRYTLDLSDVPTLPLGTDAVEHALATVAE
jgi:hypothetical protein